MTYNLILIEEETGKWIILTRECQWFFLGGPEDDTHPYRGMRGWGGLDVQVHQMESGWGYQGQQLQHGDILQDSATSRLHVQLVRVDDFIDTIDENEISVSDASNVIMSQLGPHGWGGDHRLLSHLASMITTHESADQYLWQIRNTCGDIIYNENCPAAKAFAVYTLAELARNDERSVNFLAGLLADRVLNVEIIASLFASWNYVAARNIAILLPALSAEVSVELANSGLSSWLLHASGIPASFERSSESTRIVRNVTMRP